MADFTDVVDAGGAAEDNLSEDVAIWSVVNYEQF
jgi:hypothetical protein